VIVVSFKNGLRVVYKPKCIKSEQAFYKFIDWLNQQHDGLALKSPRNLTRSDYGWAEFIQHQPCESAQEVRDYFERSGQLCALFLALRGMDYQKDNLIAAGPFPVPIDHEMLFSTDDRARVFGGQQNKSSKLQFEHSVIKTKLLPVWQPHGDNPHHNVGALECRHPGTAAHKVAQVLPAQAHIPVFNDQAQFLDDHLDEFLVGFQTMYTVLIQKRETLLNSNGPLSVFAGAETRFLLRPTHVYLAMRRQSLQATALTDTLAFDRLLQQLWRLASACNRLDLSPAIEYEKAAMTCLDIPRFTTTTDGHNLVIADGSRIDKLFEESGLDLVRRQISSLSLQNMAAQIRLIHLLVDCYTQGKTPTPVAMEQAWTGSHSK